MSLQPRDPRVRHQQVSVEAPSLPSSKRRQQQSGWWESAIEEAMQKVNPSLADSKWKGISWATHSKQFCNFVLLPLFVGHTVGDKVIYTGAGYYRLNQDSGEKEWRPFEPNTWESKIRTLGSYLKKAYDQAFSWDHEVFQDDDSPFVALNSSIKKWRTVRFNHKYFTFL